MVETSVVLDIVKGKTASSTFDVASSIDIFNYATLHAKVLLADYNYTSRNFYNLLKT